MVVYIAALMVIIFGVMSLFATGLPRKLTRLQQDVAQSVSIPESVQVRVLSVALGVGMLWMAWRLCRIAAFARLRVSTRISNVAAAAYPLLLGVMFLGQATSRAPLPGIFIFTRVTIGLFVFLLFVSSLIAASEWFIRRQRLVRAGIAVPSRGFGVSTGVVVVAINAAAYFSLAIFDKIEWTSPRAVVAATVVLVVLMFGGIILAMAWGVAGWLYVRRVDKFYEEHRAALLSDAGRLPGQDQ